MSEVWISEENMFPSKIIVADPAAAMSGFSANEQWGGSGIGPERDQKSGLDLQPDAISGYPSYPTSVCTPSRMSVATSTKARGESG